LMERVRVVIESGLPVEFQGPSTMKDTKVHKGKGRCGPS
jgi:hypothetical protein